MVLGCSAVNVNDLLALRRAVRERRARARFYSSQSLAAALLPLRLLWAFGGFGCVWPLSFATSASSSSWL